MHIPMIIIIFTILVSFAKQDRVKYESFYYNS